MKWADRERKLNTRRRYRLQDKVHREKGRGKDKQSKKRLKNEFGDMESNENKENPNTDI